MPTQRLSVEELEKTRAILKSHALLSEAARLHAVSENTLRSRKRILDAYDAGHYIPLQARVPVGSLAALREDKTITSYEQAWAEWAKYLGDAQDHYAKPPKRPKRKRQKIAIIGDLHVPFHDRKALAAFLAREKDADVCIINGDLQDFYSVSRFTKYEACPFEEELAQLQIVMESIASTFPRVIVVEGNHDKPRFERQLRERLPEEMVKVVEFLSGGNLSVISAVARRFPNVEMARNIVDVHRVGWFYQLGDLIVTHAEKYSKVPGATLRGIDEWFTDFESVVGIQPYRVVLQAHTHALGCFPWKANRLLVEGGCCCTTHGYMLTARIGGRPQRRGWVTLYQDDGVTDLNSVRMTWWDAEQDRAA